MKLASNRSSSYRANQTALSRRFFSFRATLGFFVQQKSTFSVGGTILSCSSAVVKNYFRALERLDTTTELANRSFKMDDSRSLLTWSNCTLSRLMPNLWFSLFSSIDICEFTFLKDYFSWFRLGLGACVLAAATLFFRFFCFITPTL